MPSTLHTEPASPTASVVVRLAMATTPMATFDDETEFNDIQMPALRSANGRVSRTAITRRSSAAVELQTSVPVPFLLRSRSTGAFLGGLFGSRYTPHGGHSSGIATASVPHYCALLSGIFVVDVYNHLPASGTERGAALLAILSTLRQLDPIVKGELAEHGLLWAKPSWSAEIAALWCVQFSRACLLAVLSTDRLWRRDDYYAAVHFDSLPPTDPELLARAAVAYKCSRAAKERLATVLVERLRAANGGHDDPVPLLRQQTASGQHTQLGAELVALSTLVDGDLRSWAVARGNATMGTSHLDGEELLEEVVTKVAVPAETGMALLQPETEWPAWMERRARQL